MPQMHFDDNYLLNTIHASVQERKILNKQEQQQNLDIQRQSQVLQEPLCIKNETERDIYQTKLNGHWTQQEHELYLEFIKNHFDILKSQYDKKSKKIFKMMSQFILTRTATQCRSHHQKFNPLQQIKRKKKSK
ncbi:unnamed protein product [Paramecium primaurelia]|uniref:Myb-like domain-containing protein n=1 Tax=Paramecium primaurelia TaxID=5886 RepID=A0A8S1M687_PARPR|nr:unnamed protein product [Paramecium primaurelia]